jgi:hypothetical protein
VSVFRRVGIRKSKCSASNLIFDWDGKRTFLRPNFAAREKRVRELSLQNPFLLHSDVSRYYHSIYTHSIPWALHTKQFAKANRHLNHFGNRLDRFVRNGQDGQTIGLPVGPESSRVLAEIIGVALDEAICHADGKLKRSMVRFVDDITAGAQSGEDAERARNVIRKTLHSFQLEINEDKTETVKIVSHEYGSWRHELHARMPRASGAIAKYEMFFDLVLRLSELWPRANVPVYALKQAREGFIKSNQWLAIEDFILMIYRSYPATLATIVELLVNRNYSQADVSLAKVGTFIRSNLKVLLDTGRLGELAWMLFLAKALRISIKTSEVRALSEAPSSVCALLLCDLEVKGYLEGKLDKTAWNKWLNPAGLVSEMWLYVYEATLKSWTGTSSSFLNSHPQFSELFKRQVSFYDDKKNFQPVSTKLKLERRDRKKQNLAFSNNLEDATLDLLEESEGDNFGFVATNDFYYE